MMSRATRPALFIMSTAALMLAVLGCTGRAVPAAPGPLNEPRASWIIRAGPNFTDEDAILAEVPGHTDPHQSEEIIRVRLYHLNRAKEIRQ